MIDYNEPISDAGHVVGDGLVQRIKDLEAQIERLREALEKMLLWTSGEEGGPAIDEAKEAARAALEAKP